MIHGLTDAERRQSARWRERGWAQPPPGWSPQGGSETEWLLLGNLSSHDVTGCLQGQAFRAVNPTIETGIAQGIITSFTETNAVLAIVNTAGGGGPYVVPNFVRLINTVAGATTSSAKWAMALDNGNRVSSGGTVLSGLRTRSGLLTSGGVTPTAQFTFGNVTTTAASATRAIVGHGTLKVQAAPCWVVGDEVTFTFGMQEQGLGSLNGSTVNRYTVPVGIVAIDPGDSCLIHLWNVANATTPPSWEVEVGWYEIPKLA